MRWRVILGAALVALSLVMLRFFQLSDASLLWIGLMGGGVLIFALGSKWVLDGVQRLAEFREMWPVFSAAMGVAWLIHAVQIENYASSSVLGKMFGVMTVDATVALLHLSNVPVTASGDILAFGPPSLIGAVEVTPLCGGFLSVLMFIVAFNFVTFEVGKSLGITRLTFLLISGLVVTLMAAILRVFVVTLVGFYWGFDALELAHTYLGYALFLSVASAFWYIALTWNKRLAMPGNPSSIRSSSVS